MIPTHLRYARGSKTSRCSVWSISLLIVAATMSADLGAFEIAPKHHIHEWITGNAATCSVTDSVPKQCSPSAKGTDVERSIDLSASSLGSVTIGELTGLVKWPDDPTRQVRLKTIVKFGGTFAFKCGTHAGDLRGGVLCNSHFGRLQFFHAMAADDGELPADTREVILQWADLLYRLASGALDPGTPYCGFLSRTKPETSLLAERMNPGETFFGCTDKWTLANFFLIQCSNIFSSAECYLGSDPLEARKVALGALLHLVQDSYSPAHTCRGSCENGADVRQYSCGAIAQFYSYVHQNSKKHGVADEQSYPGQGCAGRYDAVSASAAVLWHIAHKKSPDKFRAFVADNIFVPRPQPPPLAAGPGDLFKR